MQQGRTDSTLAFSLALMDKTLKACISRLNQLDQVGQSNLPRGRFSLMTPSTTICVKNDATGSAQCRILTIIPRTDS
jgi:hypothetical protein